MGGSVVSPGEDDLGRIFVDFFNIQQRIPAGIPTATPLPYQRLDFNRKGRIGRFNL
jgi:hypothetical protein